MRKIIENLVYIVLSSLAFYIAKCFLGDKTNDISVVSYFIMIVFATFVVLILYDFMIMFVSRILKNMLYDRTVKKIENIEITKVLRCIKINYLVSFINYYVRLYWVRIGFGEKKEIYSYIWFSNFKYKIEILMKWIFSPPVLISAAYVFVLKNNIKTYDFSFLLKLIEISIVDLKIKNMWEFIERVPVIISMLPLLLIFYRVGNRNRIKSIVFEKKNKNKKIVIYKIFELSSYFEEGIYKISKNMETLLRKQNFIAGKRLENEIENYCEISGRNNFVSMDFCHAFDEIEMADEIEKIVKELFCRDNIKYFEEFSFYSYRFRVLYSTLSFDYAYDFKNNNKHGTSLYLLLNPSKYIQDILQISKDSNKRKASDDYEKLLFEKKSSFSKDIYDALELLFYIGLFVAEFNCFIKNGSTEALIREIADKSK